MCLMDIISPTDIEDNCKNVACQNGGTCQDKVNNFTCECPSGIGGTFCELGK